MNVYVVRSGDCFCFVVAISKAQASEIFQKRFPANDVHKVIAILCHIEMPQISELTGDFLPDKNQLELLIDSDLINIREFMSLPNAKNILQMRTD